MQQKTLDQFGNGYSGLRITPAKLHLLQVADIIHLLYVDLCSLYS